MGWTAFLHLILQLALAQDSYAPERLFPTQFDVGRKEVDVKYEAFSKLTSAERRAYIARKKLTLVEWNDRFYVVDGHHDVCVVQEWNDEHPDEKLELRGSVKKKFRSSLSEKKFWKKMVKRKWAWNIRQNGEIVPPSELGEKLPKDFRSMGDDLYRSLAWFVRLVKGFKDLVDPFQEFRYAREFQKHIELKAGMSDAEWEAKTNEAAALARTERFRKFRGFIENGPPPNPCNLKLIFTGKAA